MKRIVIVALFATFVVTVPANAGEVRQRYISLYQTVETQTGNIRGKPILHESPSEERLRASISKIKRIQGSRLEKIAASERAVSQVSSGTSSSSSGGGGEGVPAALEAIARCESGGDYGAVNSSSGAGGKYQFLPSTWAALGGSGSPQSASPAEQDRMAVKLWNGGAGRGNWVC